MPLRANKLMRHRTPLQFRPGRVVVYVLLSLICLSVIFAFAWVLMISLKTTSEFLTTSPWSLPKKPQFANYALAWKKARIGSYFVNSIMAASVGSSISIIVSALAAYVIGRINFRLNRLMANYFLVGYMIPLMLTVIPLYFLLAGISNLNPALAALTSGWVPLLGLYIASGVPFNTFVLQGFFESLPSEMEEAAAIDGASPLRTFWQIMLPLVTSGLVSAFLINFLSLWNEFFLALIFLKKANATLPLGLFYMAQRAEYTAQWTDLFAAVLITTVPILIIFLVMQKQIYRGMTQGALKG